MTVKVRRVYNMKVNQVIVYLTDGTEIFNSYGTNIAEIDNKGNVTLDKRYWNYSTTTGKYRNEFLNETKPETEKKIKSGEYVLANLN